MNIQKLDPYDIPIVPRPMAAPAQRAAFIGPDGSNGAAALRRHLGRTSHEPLTDARACHSIRACIDALERGEVPLAVVPWRNALGGAIHEAVDAVLRAPVQIVETFRQPIAHVLAVRPGVSRQTLQVVRSHPEALRQCRALLDRLGVATQPAASTSAAALAAAREPVAAGVGALCTPQAAQAAGLSVLEDNAADHPDNATIFACVRAGRAREIDPDSGLAILSLRLPDRCGSLSQALVYLAEAGISLAHLESRPVPGRVFEVQFVMELRMGPDVPIRHVLGRLSSLATSARILGRSGQDPSVVFRGE